MRKFALSNVGGERELKIIRGENGLPINGQTLLVLRAPNAYRQKLRDALFLSLLSILPSLSFVSALCVLMVLAPARYHSTKIKAGCTVP